MKTLSANAQQCTKNWILIDATDLVVGRLASFIAKRLRGKHLTHFTPHADTGDCVVVINADKIKFTGKKIQDKLYYWHTGFPGGIKSITPAQLLEKNKSEQILEKAVLRMLPDGPLAKRQFGNLYVYSGSEHPHAGQSPSMVDFAKLNVKNKIG